VKSPDGVKLRAAVIAAGGRATDEADGEFTVRGLPAPRIGELAAHDGLVLYQLATQRASLEEAFMELTRESTEYGAPSVPTDAAVASPADGGVR
jgi:ABC-2 type transport system ATP-binding protein